MVVAGTPDNSGLNGFFYFPCSVAPCGSGFMNTRVVAKGYTVSQQNSTIFFFNSPIDFVS